MSKAAELITALKSKAVFDKQLAYKLLVGCGHEISTHHIKDMYKFAQSIQQLDHVTVNILLAHFARHGNALEAQNLINKAVEDGVRYHYSWYTNLASAWAVDRKYSIALNTLNTMKGMKGRVFLSSFPTLIRSLGESKSGLSWCLAEFFRIVKQQIEVPTQVYHQLISQSAKIGNAEICIQLYNEMKKSHVEVNEQIYDIVIDAYSRGDEMVRCMQVVGEMKEKGMKLSLHTYNVLLVGFARTGKTEMCETLFQEMQDEGVVLDSFTYCVMMGAHKKAGNVTKCVELFNTMLMKGMKPNAVAYTTLIGAHGQAGNVEECEKIYKEMQLQGVKPNAATYAEMANMFDKAENKQPRNIVEKGLVLGSLLSFLY